MSDGNGCSGCGCLFFICAIVLLLIALVALGFCGDAESQRWVRETLVG